MAKDLFSKQSSGYSQYRPTYPAALFDYILSFVPQKEVAWDCATGNGQAASVLADSFKKVVATDISAAQLAHAVPKENIEYMVCPAEQTPFVPDTFDLITIAQAYHWLNWPLFHQEAYRVGKNGAVVAIWNYNLLQTDRPEITQLINHFYLDITGPYWEPERKYVDDNYASALFDFEPLSSKEFSIQLPWNRQHITGYLNTWSAVQKYQQVNGTSPLPLIQKSLDEWLMDNETIAVTFPLHLRLGRILK